MSRRRRTTIIVLLAPIVALWAQSPSIGDSGTSSPGPTAVERVDSRTLRIALVQYAVDGEDYRSLSAFSERVGAILDATVVHHRPDVVVFPEYTSVFALFGEYLSADGELVPEATAPVPVHGALAGEDGALRLDGASDVAALRDLFRREALRDEDAVRSVWSELARTHRVWIVAGSIFVVDGEGELRNRAWVFSPDGDVAYHQDKVFLTPFERDLLGLSPGRIERARTFVIDGFSLGLTICRDSYFEVWEGRFGNADVWLDIRANGELWNEAVRRRFEAALPERVANTRVEWGMSTSLNGRFADFLWQGPAFVVDERGTRVRQSPVIDGDHVLVHDITADGS